MKVQRDRPWALDRCAVLGDHPDVPHRLRSTALAAAAIALAPVALAQRLLVPHSSPRGLVALVDAGAGVLIDGAWLDVQSTAKPAPSANSLRDAERVGDQVWVAGGMYVYRYDVATRAFLGSIPTRGVARSIEWQGERVLVATPQMIHVLDMAGNSQGRMAITGAGDTLDLGDGSMLVARRDESRIDRFTRDGVFMSVFAGPQIPTPLGVLSRPLQLAPRLGAQGESTILVCGDVRTYEFSLGGDLIREFDVGFFEGGVHDTLSGRWLVSLSSGLVLLDAETGARTTIGGPFFGTGRKIGLFDRGGAGSIAPADPTAEVICEGEARLGVLGSAVATDRLMSLFVDRLPPGALCALVVARDAARPAPGASPGLCVHRGSGGIVGNATFARSDGQVRFTLVDGPVGQVALAPFVDVYAQAVYRDGLETRLTSAIRLRLR